MAECGMMFAVPSNVIQKAKSLHLVEYTAVIRELSSRQVTRNTIVACAGIRHLAQCLFMDPPEKDDRQIINLLDIRAVSHQRKWASISKLILDVTCNPNECLKIDLPHELTDIEKAIRGVAFPARHARARHVFPNGQRQNSGEREALEAAAREQWGVTGLENALLAFHYIPPCNPGMNSLLKEYCSNLLVKH
jgi:hypothetical protein